MLAVVAERPLARLRGEVLVDRLAERQARPLGGFLLVALGYARGERLERGVFVPLGIEPALLLAADLDGVAVADPLDAVAGGPAAGPRALDERIYNRLVERCYDPPWDGAPEPTGIRLTRRIPRIYGIDLAMILLSGLTQAASGCESLAARYDLSSRSH